LGSSDRKSSLAYFLKSSPEIAKDYYLGLGRSYQYNLKFDEAKEAYSKYLFSLRTWEQKDAKKLVDQLSGECEVSKEILVDSVAAFIINLGPLVNTYYDEYGAVLNPKETKMYFSSKRPFKEPNKRVSRFKFKERIMQVGNNGIDEPANSVEGIYELDFRVNTSIAGFDKVEEKVYLYKGKKHNGRLFSSVYDEQEWSRPKPLRKGVNHIAYKVTTVSVDKNGTYYFVSDRRGGFGGKDIWFTTKKINNSFNKPINLGDTINTPFDEESVFITEDGNTLYFSSKGGKGMGGFDVYKSVKNDSGKWEPPVNMGYPINSAADELFYYPTKDSMLAVYSTVRGDSYGGMDIYKIQRDPRIPFKLLGSVVDVESGKTLNASVNIYDNSTQKLINSVKVDSLAGIYMLDFEDVGDYFIQIDCQGYKTITEKIVCPEIKYATVVQDFSLELLRHPFTLVGRVTDVDKGSPIQATLTFKLASDMDVIKGRAVSEKETGKYTITFEDKYNMIIDIQAEDYFNVDEPISAEMEKASVLAKNIELKRSKIEYTLTGRIANEDDTKPVYAALSFYRPTDEEPFTIVISDSTDGKFTATIEEQGPFMIEVEANGYFFLNEIYQFPDGQTFTAKNFNLKRMETGVKMVVKNILFNSGKATLKSESFAELDKLADLLSKNPKVRIEVSGHTDNVGSTSVNKRISKSRALTVKNYLVSRGVEQDRIEYQGYGFDQPIAPNDTPEGRAKNRRVELKILD
jgi:outer membrane protein OmpA-like peptidoglycan-associated protein